VHTSAKARLTSVAIRIRISDPDCHQNLIIYFLFTGLLPTFPENFMQIRSEVFAQSCQQRDKQTNNNDYMSLAEVIKYQKYESQAINKKINNKYKYLLYHGCTSKMHTNPKMYELGCYVHRG